MKNRESIVGLMYNLFDKEATRAILTSQATSRKPTEIMSNFNQPENQTETRSEARSKRRDGVSSDYRKDILSVQLNNISSYNGSRNYNDETTLTSSVSSIIFYLIVEKSKDV